MGSFTQGDYTFYILDGDEDSKTASVRTGSSTTVTLDLFPLFSIDIYGDLGGHESYDFGYTFTAGVADSFTITPSGSSRSGSLTMSYNGATSFTITNNSTDEGEATSAYVEINYQSGSGTKVQAAATDKTKEEYEPIPSKVTTDVKVGPNYTRALTYTVTSLVYCFENCTNVTTAPVIPESITNMYYCFYRCTALTGSIYFLNSPSPDDNELFSGTTQNIQIVCTESARYSWSNIADMFSNVSMSTTEFIAGDYKYYILENGVTPRVMDMSKISYADIPETVTYNNITHTVTSLEYGFDEYHGTFAFCENMVTAPKIPNTVTNLIYAFSNCTSLKNVVIPDGVIEMDHAFYWSEGLITAPKIPDSVEDMRWAFAKCTALTNPPNIPPNVYNLNSCFLDCTNLTGQLYCYGAPNQYGTDDVFEGTAKDIELIVISTDTTVLNTWQTIANEYSNVKFDTENPDADIIIGDYLYSRDHTAPGRDKASGGRLTKTTPLTVTLRYNPIGTIGITYQPFESGQITTEQYFDIDCDEGAQVVTEDAIKASYDGGRTIKFETDTDYDHISVFDIYYDHNNAPVNYCNATVTDATKETYGIIQTSISVNGVTFPVTSLKGCFANCISMTSAPVIPASINDMSSCFYGCSLLTGKINVLNNPTETSNMFTNTQSEIYIMNTNTSSEANWIAIADQYTNVHYGARDSLSPTISRITVIRTETDEDTTSVIDMGNYFYITIYGQFYNSYIPDKDNTIDVDETAFLLGDTPVTTWTQGELIINPDNSFTLSYWIPQHIDKKIYLYTTITDTYRKSSAQNSKLITGIRALLDYYHNQYGEAMTVGRYASDDDIDEETGGRFVSALPAWFENEISLLLSSDEDVYKNWALYGVPQTEADLKQIMAVALVSNMMKLTPGQAIDESFLALMQEYDPTITIDDPVDVKRWLAAGLRSEYMNIDTTAQSGVDHDLTALIDKLGWGDVIKDRED